MNDLYYSSKLTQMFSVLSKIWGKITYKQVNSDPPTLFLEALSPVIIYSHGLTGVFIVVLENLTRNRVEHMDYSNVKRANYALKNKCALLAS